ncbi:MAG TPA: hypothetical protein VFK82_02720 [Burkholderiaceae bacterium]|nr:hypothetical protein [Burkholderiaceae bacterium]
MPDLPPLAILLDGWRGWMPPAELAAVLAAPAQWQISDAPAVPAGADPGYSLAADLLGMRHERQLAQVLSGAYEATPCHWMAGRDHVVMQPTPHPTPEESAALLDAARKALDDVGMDCDPAGRWTVRAGFDLSSPGPLGALGRNVGALLPMDRTPVAAKQFFNLLQMVWHDHPVNEARARRSAAPINAVWLCGASITETPVLTTGRAGLMPAPGTRTRKLAAGHATPADARLLWLESVREQLLNGFTDIDDTVRADLQLLAQTLAATPMDREVMLLVTGPDGVRCIRRSTQPTGLQRLMSRFRSQVEPAQLLQHVFG